VEKICKYLSSQFEKRDVGTEIEGKRTINAAQQLHQGVEIMQKKSRGYTEKK